MSFSEYYNDLALNPNNLSFWYPLIKDCGIKTPATVTVKVPERIAELFFMEKKGMTQIEMMEEIYDWVKNEFIPKCKEGLNASSLWFLKNGGFSNKFKFSDCMALSGNPMSMTDKIIDINYTALMFDAEGITEMSAREFIHPAQDVPCIYSGMPMRTEVRIFYDFDNHHVVYAVDYWKASYCEGPICRNPTDAYVYRGYYYSVIHPRYDIIKEKAIQLVEEKLANVTGFTGIWSVDLLDNETSTPYAEPDFYLIDMAMGKNSAYWDKDKVFQYTENLKNKKERLWVE